MLYTTTIIVETICLIISLVFLNNEKSWWKYFKWFLLLTVITEVCAYYWYFVLGKNNHWIFNFYLPIEVAFIFVVLSKFLKVYSRRDLIIKFIVFLISYIIESFVNHFREYSSVSNDIASVLIIIECCIYYYLLLRKSEYINITSDSSFWIVSGLFLFYFGSTASNLFQNQLVRLNAKTIVPVRYIIFLVLNFIMYACFSYAFICRSRHKISSG